MGLFRTYRLLGLLLLLICLAIQETSSADARPLPFQLQNRYSKAYATLGVLCKCCDGVEGDSSGGQELCTTSWDGSCTKLQCLPWKLQ